MQPAQHLLCLLVGLLVLSHDGHGETAGHGGEASGTGEEIALNNTCFALSFYHLLTSQTPGSNVFFSPLSISAAYAMLSLGARSDTRTQILEGLGFELPEASASAVHRGFQNLLRTLGLPDDELVTSTGSALFLSQELPILPRFLNDTMAFYGSEVFPTNFLDSENTTQLINGYVEKETRGKIKNVISQLDRDTVMVLVSYIYFKGHWVRPFTRSERPSLHDFYVDEKTVVKVPMMSQDGHEHWFLHDSHVPCSVLRMDYRGSASALFILPDQGKMRQVEEALTPEMLARWNHLLHNRSSYRKLKLLLPKFSISGSYNLEQILPMLGIRDLFLAQRANLSGISTQQNLLLSKSFHKAVLDVDEAGTEAAAVTISSVSFLSARHNPSVLRFNRPFLMVILSTSTQSVLFLAKVVNPTEP